jgi:Protein of unknown function (DUF4230)
MALSTEESPRRSRFRPLSKIASVLVALAVVVGVGLFALHSWWGGFNPFAEHTTVRSGPVVLRSIQNMSRYEAAVGNYQVVVDLEKNTQYVPSALKGKRTLFVGSGSVNAYVDFSQLGTNALTVSKDRTTVTVRLSHAQLERTNLDPQHSYVFATQQGLLDRIGAFVSGSSGNEQALYVLAAQKIQTAAADSGLLQRADTNTQNMLTGMLRALGFTKVTVTYATPMGSR